MKTKRIEAHRGPPLSTVLREVVERLVADDWVKYATDDGRSLYYVVGVKAQEADANGLDHLSLFAPSGGNVTVVGERQLHSQVARPRPGEYYLQRAKTRLQSTGIESVEIERFLEMFERGEDFSAVAGQWGLRRSDRFAAFIDVLQALALCRGVSVDEIATDAERAAAIGAAIQKVYLEELSRLFPGILRRAGPLEQLDFVDDQLNEASRCFLYGFFRAAVVLSASALETNLIAAIGPSGAEQVDDRAYQRGGKGYFNRLVDEAHDVLGPRDRLGEEPPLVRYSREIFAERTKVVHKGLNPSKDAAEELLLKARQVIEHLRDSTRPI
jgi:hypothetical protein